MEFEYDTLEVQEDIDDIFLDTIKDGLFMHDTGDGHFGRRIADHGRQQYAAECVAQRMAITAFERFHFNNRTSFTTYCQC